MKKQSHWDIRWKQIGVQSLIKSLNTLKEKKMSKTTPTPVFALTPNIISALTAYAEAHKEIVESVPTNLRKPRARDAYVCKENLEKLKQLKDFMKSDEGKKKLGFFYELSAPALAISRLRWSDVERAFIAPTSAVNAAPEVTTHGTEDHTLLTRTSPVMKTLYEQAVEGGFKGTEQEWLTSLKGTTTRRTDAAIWAAGPNPPEIKGVHLKTTSVPTEMTEQAAQAIQGATVDYEASARRGLGFQLGRTYAFFRTRHGSVANGGHSYINPFNMFDRGTSRHLGKMKDSPLDVQEQALTTKYNSIVMGLERSQDFDPRDRPGHYEQLSFTYVSHFSYLDALQKRGEYGFREACLATHLGSYYEGEFMVSDGLCIPSMQNALLDREVNCSTDAKAAGIANVTFAVTVANLALMNIAKFETILKSIQESATRSGMKMTPPTIEALTQVRDLFNRGITDSIKEHLNSSGMPQTISRPSVLDRSGRPRTVGLFEAFLTTGTGSFRDLMMAVGDVDLFLYKLDRAIENYCIALMCESGIGRSEIVAQTNQIRGMMSGIPERQGGSDCKWPVISESMMDLANTYRYAINRKTGPNHADPAAVPFKFDELVKVLLG